MSNGPPNSLPQPKDQPAQKPPAPPPTGRQPPPADADQLTDERKAGWKSAGVARTDRQPDKPAVGAPARGASANNLRQPTAPAKQGEAGTTAQRPAPRAARQPVPAEAAGPQGDRPKQLSSAAKADGGPARDVQGRQAFQDALHSAGLARFVDNPTPFEQKNAGNIGPGRAYKEVVDPKSGDVAGYVRNYEATTGVFRVEVLKRDGTSVFNRTTGELGLTPSEVQPADLLMGAQLGSAVAKVGVTALAEVAGKLLADAGEKALADTAGKVGGDALGDAISDVAGKATVDGAGKAGGDALGDPISDLTGKATADGAGKAAGEVTGKTAGDATGTTLADAEGKAVANAEGKAVVSDAAKTGPATTARALAAQKVASGERVVVNLGGAGASHEPAGAININNQIVGRKNIPNLVKADASDIGTLFKPASVDKIEGHNMAPGAIDWARGVPGASDVLKSGGKFSYYYRGANAEARALEQALKDAGFKDVRNVADVLVTAVKP
jgi:hypothetical protein